MYKNIKENRNIKLLIVFLVIVVAFQFGLGRESSLALQENTTLEPIVDNVPSVQLNCPKTKYIHRARSGIQKKRKYDVVALASFPGSGNTWLREMIQQGLGYWTGAVYNDKNLLHHGFSAEGKRDSSVIVVKTHAPIKGCFSKLQQEYKLCPRDGSGLSHFTGTLFVIRNPFDTILADFQRLVSGRNHTGVATPADFERPMWKNYVSKRAVKWNFHVSYYTQAKVTGEAGRITKLPDIRSIGNQQYQPDPTQIGAKLDRKYLDSSGKPVHLISFELLRYSFATEYAEIMDGLRSLHHDSISLPNTQTAIGCAKRPITEQYHRKRSKKLFNPFTLEQIRNLCEVTKETWLPQIWGVCDGRLAWQRIL